ncbi:hypothetical protein Tco_0299541 [Tanacetum coccineum]
MKTLPYSSTKIQFSESISTSEILERRIGCSQDKEPPTDLKLKPLPDNLEYAFLEEPSFLPIIISSSAIQEKKNKQHMRPQNDTSKPLLGKQ